MTNSGFGSGFSDSIGIGGFNKGFYSPPRGTAAANLILHYDIGNAASYPGSGATVTDLKGNSNVTLYNGPTYSSGYLTFDGSNDTLITNTSLASKVPTDITNMGDGSYANMRLGQFQVYNAALNSTEVEQVFNSSRSTYGI